MRIRLAERVRKHVSRTLGTEREYSFVIEGHSSLGAPTYLHMHGAIATRVGESNAMVATVLAKAAVQNPHGRGRVRRAVRSKWFERLRLVHPNYLFTFRTRRDPRLDERRFVMSRAMTQPATMFWIGIAQRRPWV